MNKTLDQATSLREDRVLRYSALIFAAGLFVHSADHWRRGFNALTPEVYWAGTGLSILGVIAIALVLMRHRLAPIFAVAVGFPTALGVAASHLLPHWSSFSDAFPGSGVGALSYAALVEITSALVLGAPAHTFYAVQDGAGLARGCVNLGALIDCKFTPPWLRNELGIHPAAF